MRARLFVPALLAICLAGTSALADTLAMGEPSSALEIDDGFVTGVDQPTALAVLPDGRIVIAEREGAVRVRTADGMLVNAGSFSVNSSHGEQGLLNVVAHPDFASNRLLFFYYSAGASAGGSNQDRHRVVSIELGADNRLVMTTERILLRGLLGPANHNGGALAILGDKLFVGTGDTGANSNRHPRDLRITNYFPTCFTNANGKVLRVNLDGTIPSDNPLMGKSVSACGSAPGNEPTTMSEMARTEIWAWGFRNAFRIWGDAKTGNVWVGDVGEITYEEINVVGKAGGQHFGWPFREGNEGAPPARCADVEPDVGNCVEPAYFCEQGDANPNNPDVPNDCSSITGGVILDGCEWPAAFEGRYVFGDFDSRQLWTLQVNAERSGTTGQRVALGTTTGGPVQFVEHGGALYVVSHSGNGHITRIAPQNPEPACNGSGGGGAGAGGSPSAGSGGSPSAGSGGSPSAGTGGSPSGGSGGSPSAGNATAGSAGAAGSSGGDDDGGCGCRLVGARTPLFGALGLAAALAALGLGRRYRRRR